MSVINGLSDADEERLRLLQEECAEIIQAASKVLRFGYESTNNGRHPPNRDLLEGEIGDLFCIVNMMFDAKDIGHTQVAKAELDKFNRINKFLQYQQV